MKRLYFILCFIMLGCMCVIAAPKDKGSMRKELKEFKLKFLAQEMELTAEQQPKFFELYDKMMDEKHAAFAGVMTLKKKLRHNKDATEADYEALSKALQDARAKDVEIDRRYERQMSTFLTARQIIRWHEAEQVFRNKMSQMKKHKHRDKVSKKQ